MPRYHFHCTDGVRDPDLDGTDLPDEQAARHMAAQFAGEMLKLNPEGIWNAGSWRVEVTDPRNMLLFTILAMAIDAPRPGPSTI